MSSLFSTLWRHCSKETKPRENFFSDIVAELFKAHPELLSRWLQSVGVTVANTPDPEISIQEAFHSEDGDRGFYDLFIRLRDGAGTHLIVVESKLDSTARGDQLKNYQKDLTRRLAQTPPEAGRATLIYITRDYENQEPPEGRARFFATRWERFFQVLETFCNAHPSWFAAQVRDFLKEHRIAVPVQITPAHLEAFLHVRPCLEMFDAVLDSELLEGFKQLRGCLMVSSSQRLESLKQGWIYGLRAHHGNWQVGFHLGFWHSHPEPGVVYAGGYLCFNLRDPKALQALSLTAKRLEMPETWNRYATNDFAQHPGFVWARPLKEALARDNNAAALRLLLEPVLASMRDFQRWFEFPWEGHTFGQEEVDGFAYVGKSAGAEPGSLG
jgi:hypothetical protein